MLQSPDSSPTRNRPLSVIIGAVFSILVGGLALLLGILGIVGKGGAADTSSALPNLVTGMASIVGAGGYLALRKWAVPVYLIAVIGHFVSHTMLIVAHSGSGRVTVAGILILMLVPVLSLVVLIAMDRQRRIGLFF